MEHGMDPHEEYAYYDARRADWDEQPEAWEGRHCDECGWYVPELSGCLHWDEESQAVDAWACDGYADACEEFAPCRCVTRRLRELVASALELRELVARRQCEAEAEAIAMRAEAMLARRA